MYVYVCVFVLVRECRQYVQWRPEIEETKEEKEDDENEKNRRRNGGGGWVRMNEVPYTLSFFSISKANRLG